MKRTLDLADVIRAWPVIRIDAGRAGRCLSAVMALLALLVSLVLAQGETPPVVRGVLFYSPTCPHCHDVMDDVLPPLRSQYGAQLEILEINVSEATGSQLYQAAIAALGIPDDRLGVPTLIIGGQALVGSREIPESLPGLVGQHLAAGGVDWPDIPGLPALLEAAQMTTTATAAPTPTPMHQPCDICGEDIAEPVVRAVLFWMSGCPHCPEVIDTVLPPLKAKYGDWLDIRLIEIVSAEDVGRLYQVAASVGLAKEQVVVPLLVIGDRALVGSEQIPAELPGLIEMHLAAGGVDIPSVQALAELLYPFPTRAPDRRAPATPVPGPTQPAAIASGLPATPAASSGFELAIAILIGMTAALVYAGVRVVRAWHGAELTRLPSGLEAVIPVLALMGLGVAGYLAYVETQAVAAVCGPVGDCNAVQSSPYARLFGVLPIGVLGVLGYLAILAAWAWGRSHSRAAVQWPPAAVFGLSVGGVVFSIYLTYLEPFVIGAVCAWCLSSAVIMMVLMLLSLGPALPVIASNRRGVTKSS
jgi:uncharacterized membrane protein/glutaredoxin